MCSGANKNHTNCRVDSDTRQDRNAREDTVCLEGHTHCLEGHTQHHIVHVYRRSDFIWTNDFALGY